MNRISAFVIVCNGPKPSEAIVNAITAFLEEHGFNGTVTLRDSEGIADALLAAEHKEKGLTINLTTKDADIAAKEALTAAISYVGNMFKSEIESSKESRDYSVFTLALMYTMPHDATLQKSMQIIFANREEIPNQLLKQFGMTPKAADIICSVISR